MNLIICTTPLQTLLARKIIKNYNEEFYGILYSNIFSEKIERYFNQFCLVCNKINKFYCVRMFQLMYYMLYFKVRFFNKRFNKVFVANIENILIQSILSSIKFEQLITFDDGTANILKTSMLYKKNESWKVKFVKTIFMVKYDIDTLKNCSSLHYTIYDMPNIIENTKKISLFDFEKKNIESNDVLRICLGQTLYKDKSKNIELFKKIMCRYNIKYYLPHPKEEFIIDNVKYYTSDLIFEDIILNELNNYNEIYVYTIYSSAVINVLGIDKVHIISIRLKEFESESKLMRDFGIPVENF